MGCTDTKTSACGSGDLVGKHAAWLLWWLPTAAIIAGAVWEPVRPMLWIPSLLVMGTACLVNARGCGRLHCYVTGPLFLLGAAATALDALGVVAIGGRWLLAGLVAGTAFGFGLEWVRGTYVGEPERNPPPT